MRDNGSGKTGEETSAKVDTGDGARAQGGLVTHRVEDGFGELFESEEFGDGVRDPITLSAYLLCPCRKHLLLLEQDGAET